jgi:hypothetical protein
MAEIEILQNMITDHLSRVSLLAREDPERIALQNEIEDTIRRSEPEPFNPYLSYTMEEIMALPKSERHALTKIRIQKIADCHNQTSRLIDRSREKDRDSDDDEDDDENSDENEDAVEDDDEDVDVEETAN